MIFRALVLGAVGTGSSVLGAAATVFLVNVLLSNVLDATDYGLVVLMISWAMIVSQFVEFGFLRASTKIVSIARDGADPGTVKAFLVFVTAALVVSGAVGGGALYIAIRVLSADTAFATLAAAAALLVWPLSVCRVSAGVMLGESRSLAGAFFQSGLPHLGMLLAVGGLVLWRETPGTGTIALTLLAGAYGAAVIAIAASAWSARDVWAVPRSRFPVREWLVLALPLMLIGLVQFLNRQVGTVIVGSIGDAADVAAYFPALKISEFTTFGVIAVNTVVVSRLAAAHGRQDTALLQSILTKAAILSLALTLLLSGAVLVADDVLLGLFGKATMAADVTLWILLLGQLANALTGAAGILMAMAGQERFAATTALVILALNVALHFALVPAFGIEGAAVATAASSVLWNAMLAWRAMHRLGVNPTVFSADVLRALRRR